MTGAAPLEVTFNASEARDDIAIISYAWDFGTGDTSTEINPIYSFDTLGTYEVKLTVTDTDGLMDSATISIEVTQPETEPEPSVQSTHIRLDTNPAKNRIARLLLINQPENVRVVTLYLHDGTGRLIQTYDLQKIAAGTDTYSIPVATLRDGVYHIGLKTNKGDEEPISLLVKN